MKALTTTSILLVLCVSTVSAQVWEPEMQIQLKAVGAPRVSPDGSRVVYTVNEAVTTPRSNSCGDNRAITFAAPRILNEPIGCRFSSLR